MSNSSASGGGRTGPPRGPPYPPSTAQFGGQPTTNLDVPVSVVLLLFFAVGAAVHMAMFQINRKHGYKFLFSLFFFIFCMARIAALVVRMVWATHPTNANIAILAGILTAAGVLLLFLINLIFAQRIMRACHPNFGWHPAVGGIFKGVFVTVGASLVMVIAATVQSFYTMDVETRETDRNIQLFVATYLTILAGLPVPIALLSTVLPRSTLVEKFGQGTWRGKIGLLVFTSTLLTVGAAFRAAVAYNARPINAPAWFDSKACFYCFNFLIELIVVYTYALFRFDRRFWVPDGSAEPGHYISGNKGRQSQMHRAMYQGAGAAYTQSSFTLAGKRTSMYPASVYTFTTDKAVDRHSSLYAAKGPRALSMYSSYNDSEAASSRHDQEWMERAMMELYGSERR